MTSCFFSTVGHIAVWILLQKTDFAEIYLFTAQLDIIQFPVVKGHNFDWQFQNFSQTEVKQELIRFCYKSFFFMKLFKTLNLDIVRYCQEQFCFELPSVISAHRKTKFEVKFGNFLSNKYN